jgi:serine/threonine-protein kinase
MTVASLVGTQLEGFRIDRMLGQGGMGAVFRARDLELDRDVAIKILHPHLFLDVEYRRRFVQEARAMARLHHHGIVQLYDLGESDSLLYIVSEFIRGEDLRKAMARVFLAGHLPCLGETILLLQKVCLALDYAHERGILHRDIKPANIMLAAEPGDCLPYRPVVADLGLAKLANGGYTTQAGASVGTPTHIAPEQLFGKPADRRSDIYALGVVAYELVAGNLPFRIRNFADAVNCHLNERPAPVGQYRPAVPGALQTAVMKAIAYDPDERYQTAAEFGATLRAIWQAAADRGLTALADGNTLRGPNREEWLPTDAAGPGAVGVAWRAAPRLNQVTVRCPNGWTRSVLLTGPCASIGRDADNDLVLDDCRVSRHHARIDILGRDWYVTDLGSMNGLFFDDAPIAPHVAHLWPVTATLHIGDSWICRDNTSRN